MSKSYQNTISLREKPEDVGQKIRKMPTDPQRIRRTDPGNPEKCPVWQLHEVYSNDTTKSWVQTGCRSAEIGCLQCKEPIVESVVQELAPMRERARQYEEQPQLVRDIVAQGCERARQEAEATMREVRQVMGLNYKGVV